MRRNLLWLLPLAIGVIVVWMVQVDLSLFMDIRGVGMISVPRGPCTHNLHKIVKAAKVWVEKAEENLAIIEMPSQAECRRRLIEQAPELAAMDCPLPYNQPRSGLRQSDPLSSYLINPRIFTKPTSDWKDSDVVAVDSEPRHYADLRGPGVRSVLIDTWDSSARPAFLDERHTPSLLSQIRDFGDGREGADDIATWSRYFEQPDPVLMPYLRACLARMTVVFLLGSVWLVLLYRQLGLGGRQGGRGWRRFGRNPGRW